MKPVIGACCLALFAFGDSANLPQSKATQASTRITQLPQLADMLKGYVGQNCWVKFGDGVPALISMAEATGWEKLRLEVVGQDFIKFSNEWYLPLSQIRQFRGRKP